MCPKRGQGSRTCLFFSTSQIVVWFQLWVPPYFLSCLVAEAGVDLVVSAGQMAIARNHLCRWPWFVHLFRSSKAIYKITPFSTECKLFTLSLSLPRLDFSHDKIHWRLWQGLHWFHTSWLCYTPASEIKIINLMFSITSPAIKKERQLLNLGPYEQNSRWCMILYRHLPQHPILLGTPRTPKPRALWQYKKSNLYTASINRTDWPVELLNCYQQKYWSLIVGC